MDETLADLERLSECLRIPRSNMSALIRKICRIARKRVDPLMRKPRFTRPASGLVTSSAPAAPPVELPAENRGSNSYIGVQDKREVYGRDSGQCSFVDPLTGRRSQSRFGLEYDHVVPVSFGGETNPENLRLLCKAHHYLVTQRMFGKEKIKGYIRR